MATKKKSESKKESATDKRNKKLREAYEESITNFENTSNSILESVREKSVSIYAPDPVGNAKQRPEEISDIHILYAQQISQYVKEGKDDSEEQEKKSKEKQEQLSSSESDS